MARWTRWSPIGQRVVIAIDDSGDEGLIDTTRCGTVRAYGVRNDGTAGDLLVELDERLPYCGHYTNPDIHWLTVRGCLHWSTSRLVLTWTAVRLVDAPSFVDATYDRTIGTGRMWRSGN